MDGHNRERIEGCTMPLGCEFRNKKSDFPFWGFSLGKLIQSVLGFFVLQGLKNKKEIACHI
jgi:hypothetical protein